VQALAELAQLGESVPEVVRRAYPGQEMGFGPMNIIPKPFDPRVLMYVAPAVALAAMESGVARKTISIPEYRERLVQRLGEIASL
jgi:malate dehydrogenase (oxaloacetate-decarboxylating)(NADP+)